jgi:protoheme IX farnesyltransferase
MPALLGWIYLIGSLGLGGGFIFFAWRLLRKVDIDGAKTLYLYSLLYLALVYVLLMVDSIV